MWSLKKINKVNELKHILKESGWLIYRVLGEGLLVEAIFVLSPEGVSHIKILGKRVPDRRTAKVLRKKWVSGRLKTLNGSTITEREKG